MVHFGRILSVFAALGFGCVSLMAAPSVRGILETPWVFTMFNAVSALTALTLFIAWGLAIYHWGSRYTGPRKRLWGAAVILGAFVGSWLYWLIATRRQDSTDSSATAAN